MYNEGCRVVIGTGVSQSRPLSPESESELKAIKFYLCLKFCLPPEFCLVEGINDNFIPSRSSDQGHLVWQRNIHSHSTEPSNTAGGNRSLHKRLHSLGFNWKGKEENRRYDNVPMDTVSFVTLELDWSLSQSRRRSHDKLVDFAALLTVIPVRVCFKPNLHPAYVSGVPDPWIIHCSSGLGHDLARVVAASLAGPHQGLKWRGRGDHESSFPARISVAGGAGRTNWNIRRRGIARLWNTRWLDESCNSVTVRCCLKGIGSHGLHKCLKQVSGASDAFEVNMPGLCNK